MLGVVNVVDGVVPVEKILKVHIPVWVAVL
jgi:hypothetical protein